MSAFDRFAQHGSLRQDTLLFLLAAGAVIAGVFYRFWDLGGAPLAVDEYFLGTATLNTAEHGLPEFECGGYYKRGLLMQFLTVPLLHLGASIEFAVRFWPAVASILAILAVWRIAATVGGRGVALVAVILTSLSLWEIEFGRFGRMYAPFQAAFLWYIYFQIRHLVKGEESARWWYLGISAVAILIYEGAALLLVTNFLALAWRGKRWSNLHLAVAFGLLVSSVLYFKKVLTRFPGAERVEESSLDIDSDQPLPKPETFEELAAMPDLPEHLLLVAVAAVCVLGFGLWRYHRHLEVRHPSIIYWSGAFLCFSAGFMAFGVALALAGWLLRIPCPLRESAVALRPLIAGLAILSAVWLGVLFISFLSGGAGFESSVKAAFRYVLDFPDVYFKVVAPWLHTIPVTAVMLVLLAATASTPLGRRQPDEDTEVINYLVGTSILLVLLVSILPQPYESTRYTYFLYPLLIVLASVGLARGATKLARRLPPVLATFALLVPLFVFAEDFRISHLLRINQPEIRFRTEYSPALAEHYYLRWDFRGTAEFVNDRATPDDTILAFDQPFPHYLDRINGIFVLRGTSNHELVAACDDRLDLWSNAPLLDRVDELQQILDDAPGRVWLLMRSSRFGYRNPLEIAIPMRYGLTPEYVSIDGHLAVFMIPDGP